MGSPYYRFRAKSPCRKDNLVNNDMSRGQYYIDERRIQELARRIGEKSLVLIDWLETVDPQFKAVTQIVDAHGCGVAATAVVANALISYQLTGRGEDYWRGFGEALSRYNVPSISSLLGFFEQFLDTTRYNRMAVSAKKMRVRRFLGSSVAAKLWRDPLVYAEEIRRLPRELSKAMRQDETSKTIVFAAKMYYYVAKACGARVMDLTGIAIPCDRRICLMTLTSGVVARRGAVCVEKKHVYELMGRYREVAVEAWRIFETLSGIPCIRLDALLWLLARFAWEKDPFTAITREYGPPPLARESFTLLVREFTARRLCRDTG